MSQEDRSLAHILKSIDQNQARLATLLGAAIQEIGVQGKTSFATDEDLAAVEKLQEEELIQRDIEVQKEVFTHAFARSQAYSKVIVFGFYGVFFGLHSLASPLVTQNDLKLSLVLMIISASALASYEVGSSVWVNWKYLGRLSKQRVLKPITQIGRELKDDEKRTIRRLRAVWMAVLVLSLAPAVTSVGIFANALLRSLI